MNSTAWGESVELESGETTLSKTSKMIRRGSFVGVAAAVAATTPVVASGVSVASAATTGSSGTATGPSSTPNATSDLAAASDLDAIKFDPAGSVKVANGAYEVPQSDADIILESHGVPVKGAGSSVSEVQAALPANARNMESAERPLVEVDDSVCVDQTSSNSDYYVAYCEGIGVGSNGEYQADTYYYGYKSNPFSTWNLTEVGSEQQDLWENYYDTVVPVAENGPVNYTEASEGTSFYLDTHLGLPDSPSDIYSEVFDPSATLAGSGTVTDLYTGTILSSQLGV